MALGALEQRVLDSVLEDGLRPGERLGETLVRLDLVRHEDVCEALAAQLGLRVASAPLTPNPDTLGLLPPDFVRSRGLVPIGADARSVRIAMADPLDLRSIDDVRFITGRRVDVSVSTPTAVRDALASQGDEVGAPTSAPIRGAAPAIRLVDGLLRTAIDRGASDVHIEESADQVTARARIDGRLEVIEELPSHARRTVLSRIKVLAQLDIADRRSAQDGRVPFEHGNKTLSLRISTLPVIGGEKAVVRILDASNAPSSLGSLGIDPTDLARLRVVLARGEGALLAAGPTGSGKSTTLFAALSEADRESRNVVTIEDPVEYRLAGTNQIQVDPRAGLGFAAALRSVLRQDPDVVMVGEIRDRETAEIAMAAAVTGHLVLSTIHANDAPGALTRLLQMGVPPHLVSGGLAGVVAQRLVRKTCPECRGHGCDACGSGSRGRTGVFQVLTMNDPLRDAVARGESGSMLRRLASAGGMRTIASDARRAIAAGLTNPHEVANLIVGEALHGTPCSHCDELVPFEAAGCPWCGVPRSRRCSCGAVLDPRWRYCAACLRPA